MRSAPQAARRASIGGLLATGLLLATAAGAPAQDAATLDPDADLSTQSVTVSTWATYLPADLPAAFEAETGAPVTMRYHATDAEIRATLMAGGDTGIDVAFVSGPTAQALAAAGLLEPIHPELVPGLANLVPEASQLAYDPGNVWSVPWAWGTTGLCYRTDLVASPPDSWSDLLTPADDVRGRTTMLAADRWLLLPAQKALGFSANTTDAGELEQVRQLLAAAQPTLLALDDTTFYLRLISGEASLVEAWDAWCDYARADPTVGAQVAFVLPAEGADVWADTMVIPRTSRNKEAAHAFIDHVLRPEVHRWVVENLLYKVPNRAAMDQVAPELLARFPNLAMAPGELLTQEVLVDIGAAATTYEAIAAEMAAR